MELSEKSKQKEETKYSKSEVGTKKSYDEDASGGSSGEEDEDLESAKINASDLIYHPESDLRNWLKSRGKGHCIDFEDEELRQLRIYFDSLDDDGSEEIGVDELEDPLIALGLVDNRKQVQEIVDLVDEDGSGMIEFPEFLQIIKGGSNAKEGAPDNGTGAIYQFFKDLTGGSMSIEGNENIPFSLFISSQRRRKILQAMWAKDDAVKQDGQKVLGNYKKQIAEKMARDQAEAGMFKTRTYSDSHSQFSKRSKMGATVSSIKSGKDPKDSRMQKAVQKNLNDISAFNGEPPDAEILLAILKQKKVYSENS